MGRYGFRKLTGWHRMWRSVETEPSVYARVRLRSRMVKLPHHRYERFFGWARHMPLSRMIIFAALTLVAMPSQAAIADETLEYQIKAAFLYKFGAYIDWPVNAFDSPTSPLALCILGGNEQLNTTLRKLAREERVNGHPIEIRELQAPAPEDDCHILYTGAIDPQYSAQAMEAVRGKHVLTVSDNPSQGIIGFVIADNRVRFNINDAAAAENGLNISSKLLSLAVNVKRRNAEGGQ